MLLYLNVKLGRLSSRSYITGHSMNFDLRTKRLSLVFSVDEKLDDSTNE